MVKLILRIPEILNSIGYEYLVFLNLFEGTILHKVRWLNIHAKQGINSLVNEKLCVCFINMIKWYMLGVEIFIYGFSLKKHVPLFDYYVMVVILASLIENYSIMIQISDFGLAKWLPDKMTHHTVSSFEGTFGFVPWKLNRLPVHLLCFWTLSFLPPHKDTLLLNISCTA